MVLLLVVNIEYTLPDLFFLVVLYLTFIPKIYLLLVCIPAKPFLAVNLLSDFFLYTIKIAAAKLYIQRLCLLALLK